MADGLYALEDWLRGLDEDYKAQQQEYTHAFADLQEQEQQDQYQALTDLMSGGLPPVDFHRLMTASPEDDVFGAYGREVEREKRQLRADIAASYNNAAGGLRDEIERSTQDYLQQRDKVTKLLSQGGLTELANRKIQTGTGTEKFVPEDPSLRSDIQREDVTNPDGSVTPSFHYIPKKVAESDVRATELADFLGIPEDVVRTQLLQEKIGQADLTPEAIQKRNLADIGQSIELSKQIVQNPFLAKTFEGADPESVGGRALVYADALKDALASITESKDQAADAKLVRNRVLERITQLNADEKRAPTAEELTSWTKENWSEILALKKISPQVKFDVENPLVGPPRPRRSGDQRADLSSDVGLGAGSQAALGEAVRQVGGGTSPQGTAPSGAAYPEQESLLGGLMGAAGEAPGMTGAAGQVAGQALSRAFSPQPFGEPRTYVDLLGNPQEGATQTRHELRDLFDWLGFIPKDPRVRDELARMFGLR